MKRSLVLIILSCLLTFSFVISGCSGGGANIGSPPPASPLPTYSPTPTPTAGTGTIEGQIYIVLDKDDTIPAKNAFISLIDQGISTYADADGKFVLENVWAGERLMVVTTGNSKTAGTVTVEAGKTTVVTIEMPQSEPADPGTGETTGNLTVVAYGNYDYDGNWTGVKFIRVWEDNNYSKRWFASWDEKGNEGKPSYELTCYNALKNKYYVIEVEWYDGHNQQSDTTYLYLDNQTQFIYRY